MKYPKVNFPIFTMQREKEEKPRKLLYSFAYQKHSDSFDFIKYSLQHEFQSSFSLTQYQRKKLKDLLDQEIHHRSEVIGVSI